MVKGFIGNQPLSIWVGLRTFPTRKYVVLPGDGRTAPA